MIATKSEFASLMGVSLSTVSTWIGRKQLTAPALTSDGRINVDLAKVQLAGAVDLARSRGRAPTGLFANVSKDAPPIAEPQAGGEPSVMSQYAERIARARGDLLQLELERKDFDLLIKAEKVLPLDVIIPEVDRHLRDFINGFENFLPGLAAAAFNADTEEAGVAIGDGYLAQRR